MENYPSNSQTSKTRTGKAVPLKSLPRPEKKVEQITTGTVTRRKKPLGKRFLETFGGGNAQGVAAYILTDVLLPAAKDMVADAVSQGIEKMLFGETRGPRRTSSNSRPGSSSYTSYNRYSGNSSYRKPEPSRPEMSRRGRATHNFDEIILDTRAEAQEVIDQLFTLVREYQVATVSDLYEMVGITGDFTDEKYGWFDMRGATMTRVREGYLLDLPPVEHVGD